MTMDWSSSMAKENSVRKPGRMEAIWKSMMSITDSDWPVCGKFSTARRGKQELAHEPSQI